MEETSTQTHHPFGQRKAQAEPAALLRQVVADLRRVEAAPVGCKPRSHGAMGPDRFPMELDLVAKTILISNSGPCGRSCPDLRSFACAFVAPAIGLAVGSAQLSLATQSTANMQLSNIRVHARGHTFGSTRTTAGSRPLAVEKDFWCRHQSAVACKIG